MAACYQTELTIVCFFSRIDNSQNLLLKLREIIEFPETSGACQEKLNIEFVPKGSEETCSRQGAPRYENNWKKPLDLSTGKRNDSKILTINYSKSSVEEGGKFVLQVEGWCI